MIDRTHVLPITQQAKVLNISRGSVYYRPRPVSAGDLGVMRRLDQLHLDYPFAGSRMLRDLLCREGIQIGRRRVATMMKRMGRRWKQLHRLIYPIGVLALLHFFIQTKANVAEPVIVSGLFVWMMLWRSLPAARRTEVSTCFALVPVSAVLTAAIEFAWYGLATRIDPFRILTANWSERFFPRPAHEVAAIALVVAIVVTARRLLAQRPMARPKTPGGGDQRGPGEFTMIGRVRNVWRRMRQRMMQPAAP